MSTTGMNLTFTDMAARIHQLACDGHSDYEIARILALHVMFVRQIMAAHPVRMDSATGARAGENWG